MASKSTFETMKKTPKFSSRKQVRCEITGRKRAGCSEVGFSERPSSQAKRSS